MKKQTKDETPIAKTLNLEFNNKRISNTVFTISDTNTITVGAYAFFIACNTATNIWSSDWYKTVILQKLSRFVATANSYPVTIEPLNKRDTISLEKNINIKTQGIEIKNTNLIATETLFSIDTTSPLLYEKLILGIIAIAIETATTTGKFIIVFTIPVFIPKIDEARENSYPAFFKNFTTKKLSNTANNGNKTLFKKNGIVVFRIFFIKEKMLSYS